MKKSTFVAMLLGTIGGILFALGMCMVLIPEWNAFRIDWNCRSLDVRCWYVPYNGMDPYGCRNCNWNCWNHCSSLSDSFYQRPKVKMFIGT